MSMGLRNRWVGRSQSCRRLAEGLPVLPDQGRAVVVDMALAAEDTDAVVESMAVVVHVVHMETVDHIGHMAIGL